MNDNVANAIAAVGWMPPDFIFFDLIETQMNSLKLSRESLTRILEEYSCCFVTHFPAPLQDAASAHGV
jgi:hypothetical protein